jgi:hypothetical protein
VVRVYPVYTAEARAQDFGYQSPGCAKQEVLILTPLTSKALRTGKQRMARPLPAYNTPALPEDGLAMLGNCFKMDDKFARSRRVASLGSRQGHNGCDAPH